MGPKLKNNGTAQLLMPLLGAVPAFPKVREGATASWWARGSRRTQELKPAQTFWALGLGLAKKLTHVKGHWSLLPQGGCI